MFSEEVSINVKPPYGAVSFAAETEELLSGTW
ncbi:uncharacterized protein METZ01_LOCUS267985, partial [marine metagenome]